MFISISNVGENDMLAVWFESALFNHVVLENARVVNVLQCWSGLQIRVCIGKLFSLFLIQNICCGYSKHMFELMGKKIITILHSSNLLIWIYGWFCF